MPVFCASVDLGTNAAQSNVMNSSRTMEGILPASESTRDGDLDMQVSVNGTRVLLRLAGRIMIDSSPDLRDRLLSILADKAMEQITVDLSGVSYIDLSGVATFVEALKIARASKTELKLTGFQDRPRYLLEVTGLLPFFEAGGDPASDIVSKGQK